MTTHHEPPVKVCWEDNFFKQIRMARKTQGIRGSQVKCFQSESQRGPRQGNPNVCFSKLY